MTRPNPTPEKPIVSPRLQVSSTGRWLFETRDSRTIQMCTGELGKFVEVPDAQAYWIELSRTQWPDRKRSGAAVWLWFDTVAGWWLWEASHAGDGYLFFSTGVDKFLDAHMTPHDKPTRYFFRLTYED